MSVLPLLAQTYDYTYSAPATTTESATAIGIVLIPIILIILVAYALKAWLLGRIFNKAGVPAWKAWVPIYNAWVTLQLGGQTGWLALLLIVPFVNIIAAIYLYIAMYHIGLKLGKQGVFVLWAIFLPLVWYVWLAFDDSQWEVTLASASTSNTSTPPYTPPQA